MNTLAAVLLFAVSIPNIDVIDDLGRVRSTAEWKGTPTILAPMYARCPLACPMIAQGVKRGAAESSAPISSYRVVIFSFDPRDTPADLRRFRERQRLPLHWSVVKAVHKGDERRLLDALDYHYGQAGNHWIHPNSIIALTAGGVPAKTLHGTNYDIDAALAAARGGRDWIDRYGGWMLALLMFVCLLSVVYLGSLLGAGSRLKNGNPDAAPPPGMA
jgi:cytochrome oxidase Cu insertion factor (SCO1/SenC/PrrC family)